MSGDAPAAWIAPPAMLRRGAPAAGRVMSCSHGFRFAYLEPG